MRLRVRTALGIFLLAAFVVAMLIAGAVVNFWSHQGRWPWEVEP